MMSSYRFHYESAFIVEECSLGILGLHGFCHDCFIRLTDQSNNKIQKDHENEPLVHKPDKPNDSELPPCVER